MPVLCTAPVASSPRAASLVAAVHDPSNSRSAAAAAAAVPPPPAAAAACSCPPSCLLHRGPLQFLLLNLKLEEMENVESVSLPSNATYCMTVRRPRPKPPPVPLSVTPPLLQPPTTPPTLHTPMLHTAQVKNSVGDDVREGVIVDPTETHELDNSRGTANFCLKWDRAARHQVGAGVVGGRPEVVTGCCCCEEGAVRCGAGCPVTCLCLSAHHHYSLRPFPPQAYLNVEAVKGVTRSITADDAGKVRARSGCGAGARAGASARWADL